GTLYTMRIRHLRYSLCLLALPFGSLQAQTLPVGSPVLEDYYRRQQLLGEVDSAISFSVRPLTAEALGQTNVYDPEGVLGDQSYLSAFPNNAGYVQALPAGLDYGLTGNYPYGWNDGSMVPTRGGQFRLYGGLVAKYRFLTLQFRPEIVYASNR